MGVGDGFSSLSSWGKALRGNNGRGAGMTWEGDGRFANRPYEGGSGWIATPSSRGQALRGHDEGMGPRIREDNGRGWGMGSRPCLHGGRLCAGMTRGWVPASARTREGRWGMGSRPCLHGGRLFAGMTRGWVPASARTTGGGGGGRLKGKGLPVAAGFSGDDASKARGGEMPRSDYDALLLKFLQSFPTRFDAKLG